jgi:hypothetical protein
MECVGGVSSLLPRLRHHHRSFQDFDSLQTNPSESLSSLRISNPQQLVDNFWIVGERTVDRRGKWGVGVLL